jgi:imidazolonepropionase-like amidohydrolase
MVQSAEPHIPLPIARTVTSSTTAGLLVGALTLSGGPRAPHPPTAAATVLEDVAVIDGNGTPAKHHRDILIEHGRISAIVPHGSARLPPGATRMALSGRFVLPGYVDMHEHVAAERWAMSPTGEKSARFDPALSSRLLRVLLASGVTTVRSPGSWVASTADQVALRLRMEPSGAPGPRIVTAGRILSDPTMSAKALRREIAAQVRAGVDFIKLYAAMPPALVAAAIDAAHARGVPAAGHLQRTPWRKAAELGIDFIEHGASWSADDLPGSEREGYDALRGMRARISWLERLDPADPAVDSTIAALVGRRVVVTPTLVALQSKFWGYDSPYHADPSAGMLPELTDDWRVLGTFTDDWSADELARVRRAWPRMLALTRRLHDAGVLVTAGADVGSPWVAGGSAFHHELELLVEAGIPPLEVIRIATRNGAEALHRAADIGTVEAGKRADLVVLRRDPSRTSAPRPTSSW